MAGRNVLSLEVRVRVEEREGYYAAPTVPFAITVYGNTEDEAERRALEATEILLRRHSKTTVALSAYLNKMDIKHVVSSEPRPEWRHSIVRECTREMRVEAFA